MKKLFLCIIVITVCISNMVQAQCRFVAPDAEEWIENNRDAISKMTRPEWQNLGEGYKWRVFVELSPEQKHEFIRLKLEQVRDNFDWNEAEKNHINELYSFFINTPGIYGEENEEVREANEKYVTEWVIKAREELEWSQNLLHGIAMEADDLLNKEGNVRTTKQVSFNFE